MNSTAARGDQPDLVAVPDRSDRRQYGPPLLVGPGDEPVDDAHPEVEAVQHRVDGEHGRDDREPDCFHGGVLMRRGRAAIDFLEDLHDEEHAEQQIQPGEAQVVKTTSPGLTSCEWASAVRISPWMIHGCRPSSAVHHPAVVAM